MKFKTAQNKNFNSIMERMRLPKGGGIQEIRVQSYFKKKRKKCF